MTQDSEDPQNQTARVLVADPIAEEGIALLRGVAQVDVATKLPEDDLCARIAGYDALVVRSETRVTARVLEAAAGRLKIVGRAGVGVDNIDVPAATHHGVIVVNSPEGNTIAAAEHTVAMLLGLARKIPAANASLKRGEWKRSQFVGVEVYNKVLGVVGFGKIGREVARRARGLGMRVLASDAFVTPELAAKEGAEMVSFGDLLERADYITVHTPLTKDTRGLLDDDAFARCNEGVRIINCARGGIIDEQALVRALDSGKVAAAAVDVFEQEPPSTDHPLIHHEKVIATPHLGASTQEAQINVALDVAEQIVAVLAGQPPRAAVNMPAVSPEIYGEIEPYLRLGAKMGRLHAQLADGPIRNVSIYYSGDLLDLDVQPITRSIIMGLLQPVLAQSVNFLNVPFVAESRGIRVTESKIAGDADYPNLIRVQISEADGDDRSITGVALGKRDLRIREIDQFHIDLAPEGYMLWARHTDRPGIIGQVGTLLGENQINIAGMHVGREAQGKRAMMVLTVDEPISEPLREKIRATIQADFVRFLDL